MEKEFISWESKYELGCKEIDSQHRQLVDLINKSYMDCIKGNFKLEEGEAILTDLLELARVHFSTEERYFEEFDYEEKEEHIEKHLELIDKLLEFREIFNTPEWDCKEFLEFLKEWFDNHCSSYDRKYVKCFRDHGLE